MSTYVLIGLYPSAVAVPSSQPNCNLSVPVDSPVKMAVRERWLLQSGVFGVTLNWLNIVILGPIID